MTRFCGIVHEKKQSQDKSKQSIKDFIDKEFNIDTAAKTRISGVVIPRMIAMYLIKKTYESSSLQGIADFYGIKTHATVINAINTIKNYRDTDKEFAKVLGNIEAKYAVKNMRAIELEAVMIANHATEGDFNLSTGSIRGADITIVGSVKSSPKCIESFLLNGELSVGSSDVIRFRAYKNKNASRVRRIDEDE